MRSRSETGKVGENIACKYLEAQGFEIKHRNYRAGHLETDVICENGEYVLFVEVKTRRATGANPRYGTARDAVDTRKRENLVACAKEGDALAKKLLQRSLDCWSANLCNLIVAYDPEVIILSGGIARMGEDLRKPMEEHVHKFAWTPWGHPDVRLAKVPEASVVLGLHKLTLDEIEGKTQL